MYIQGAVTGQAIMIVTGISLSGHMEILSVDIGSSENEHQWPEVFQRLKSRGLSGVEYIVSDDHKGLIKALKREFQGTNWKKCPAHFIPNFKNKFSSREVKEYLPKLKDIF